MGDNVWAANRNGAWPLGPRCRDRVFDQRSGHRRAVVDVRRQRPYRDRILGEGHPYLRVLLHTPATVATQYHGTCTTSVCMGAVSPNYFISPNVWVQIDLPFASLTSGTAPFNPALLSAIEFQP